MRLQTVPICMRWRALRCRAALASTLLAGLELGREGAASLLQEEAFGEIVVAPAGPQAPAPHDPGPLRPRPSGAGPPRVR